MQHPVPVVGAARFFVRRALFVPTLCCLVAHASAAGAEPEVSFPVGITGGYGWSPDFRLGLGVRGGVRSRWFYAGLKLDKHLGSDDRSVALAGPELGVASRLPIVVALATLNGGVALLQAEQRETGVFVAPGASLITAPSSPLQPWFLGVDARYVWLPDSRFESGAVLLGWIGIELGAAEPTRH
jgi:hypothetical protein